MHNILANFNSVQGDLYGAAMEEIMNGFHLEREINQVSANFDRKTKLGRKLTEKEVNDADLLLREIDGVGLDGINRLIDYALAPNKATRIKMRLSRHSTPTKLDSAMDALYLGFKMRGENPAYLKKLDERANAYKIKLNDLAEKISKYLQET